jgi:threonine-phosphate decarboxylase
LPDVDAGGIVGAFSRFYSIDPRQVIAGNGTTELIYLIPRALNAKKALAVGPTYSDYRDACSMNRVACDHLICREKDDFVPDVQAIRQAAATADLVFLCNPNNPTGDVAQIVRMWMTCAGRCPIRSSWSTNPICPLRRCRRHATMIGSDLPNVMVLNSMSKAFRIPGLRIGFVKAPQALIERRWHPLPCPGR